MEDEEQATEVDDGNYTQFDLNVATVNVTLSFLKWWNGRGMLEDVEVRGVRGVIDRTHVKWSSTGIDPFSYRYKPQPGDFEIESFKLEDLLVTVYQPNGFRPFSVSIYTCELPQLRKRWLFYDMMAATHISGSFDGSLFTIHPRQLHGPVPAVAGVRVDDEQSTVWKKISRLRIDGLKIDHLNRGDEGPFGWIYEGNVDIVADVLFPAEAQDGISKVMSDFYDQLEDIVRHNRARLMSYKNENEVEPYLLPTGHIAEAAAVDAAQNEDSEQMAATKTPADVDDDRSFLVMDLRVHMNDVKAAVPLFTRTRDISYVNQALVRPIVAYINAKKTYIPVSCRIVKRTSDFDGSWTTFDCGLLNDLSAETYEAFARDVEDQQSRVRRLKKVGFWTLSVAIHALFMGLAGNVL